MYGDLIFGNSLFLTKNYSLDLYNQLYPDLVTIARHMSKGEFFEQIDFTMGLGYKINIVPYNIAFFPALFGVKNVLFMLAFSQFLKVFLAGLFFYLYLKKISNDEYVAMIGAFGYAFCGPMILRQFWAFYAIEIFLVALWLYAFEAFLDKQRFLLPFATLFFFLNCNIYYSAIYVGIFMFYIFIRLFSEEKKIDKKDIIIVISIIVVSAIISVGVVSLIDTFGMVSNKVGEVSGTAAQRNVVGKSIFTNYKTYIIAFFQTIGLSIISDEVLSDAFLGTPTFYCGLIPLVSLPLLLIYFKGKKRIVYLVTIFLAAVYFAFAPIRTLANAKTGSHFKMSSFWIVLVILFIAVQALTRFFDKPEKKALIIIQSELAAIFVIGLLLVIVFDIKINVNNFVALIAFLIVYSFLFGYYFKSEQNRNSIKQMILLIVLFETAFFSRMFMMDNVDLIDKERYETAGYNDENVKDAFEFINDENEIKNYRVDKQFTESQFCDSEVYDYYSSLYYIGAMGDISGFRKFYDTMKLPTAGVQNGREYLYKVAYGTSLNTEINEILGFKYIVSLDPYIANFGYGSQYKEQFENVFVFENKYTLPMVFGYNKVISDKEFEKLTIYEKQKALMACCVVSEDEIDTFDKDMILKADDLKIDMDQFKKYRTYNFHEEESVFSTEDVFTDSTVLIKVEFDLEEPEYRARLNHDFSNGFSGNYYIRLDEGRNEYYFELNSQYISNIWFTDEKGENLTPEKCEFYVIPWDVYYKDYVNNYNKLSDNVGEVEAFSGSLVSGKIDMIEEGVLYFAAPYDNWTLYIDGEKTDIIETNIGFMGARISKGYHTYRFVYNNQRVMSVDEIIKITVLIISIIWAVVSGIIYLKKKKINNNGSDIETGNPEV